MRIRSLLAVGLGLLLAVPALASQLWFYEEVTAFDATEVTLQNFGSVAVHYNLLELTADADDPSLPGGCTPACIVVLPYHHSSGSANGWVGISYLAASSTASLFIIARE